MVKNAAAEATEKEKEGEGEEEREGEERLCAVPVPFPVLHALGSWGLNSSIAERGVPREAEVKMKKENKENNLGFSCNAAEARRIRPFWGSVNVAILFTERPSLTKRDVEFMARFDLVLAGSDWVANILRQSGMPSHRIAVFRQGIDPDMFGAGGGDVALQSPPLSIGERRSQYQQTG